MIGGPGFRFPRFGGGLSSFIVLRTLADDSSRRLRHFVGRPSEVEAERFGIAQLFLLSRKSSRWVDRRMTQAHCGVFFIQCVTSQMVGD